MRVSAVSRFTGTFHSVPITLNDDSANGSQAAIPNRQLQQQLIHVAEKTGAFLKIRYPQTQPEFWVSPPVPGARQGSGTIMYTTGSNQHVEIEVSNSLFGTPHAVNAHDWQGDLQKVKAADHQVQAFLEATLDKSSASAISYTA